jgi:hypothetical protein
MTSIAFDKYPVKINRNKVFDPVRKKWIEITPEELVRQHFIQYLLLEKKYPVSLMKMEHGIIYNKLNKRGDIVIYSHTGMPMILIECKAPTILLDEDVLMQALRYNIKLKAPYLVLSNGIQTICFHHSVKCEAIPEYNRV